MESLKPLTQEEIVEKIDVIQSQIALIENMGSRPIALTDEMLAVLNAAKADAGEAELDAKDVLLDYYWEQEAALVGLSLRLALRFTS